MSKEKLAQVFHFDLYGKREDKYDFLNENSINTIDWNTLEPKAPNHFFVKKDFEVQEIYDEGFSVNNLMPCNSVGIVTARDNFSIHNTKIELENTIKEFLSLDDETARRRFNLGKDARDWQITFAKKDLNEYYPNKGFFSKISYRPFDVRNTFYTGKSKGFHCYPRNEVMKHFLKDNIGLAGIRHNKEDYYSSVFITKFITEARLSDRFITNIFPLYLYPETTTQQSLLNEVVRIPNLNMEMVQKMDAGDMVASASTPIMDEDNVGTMFEKLAIIGRDLLLQTLPDYISGDLKPVSQDESQATFSPNINSEEERIDWSKSAREVFNQIRGMSPWPVAYTLLEGKRFKIYEVELSEGQGQPGQIINKTKKTLVVATGNGAVSLKKVQPAGKPAMQISDFLNGIGRTLEVGDKFGK